MEWPPSWLKFKAPGLKDLSTNSALNPIAYVTAFFIIATIAAACFEDKLLLHWMLGFDAALVATFIAGFIYFAIFDADRLGPPSHQRLMAKLMYDERQRISGPVIDGTLTTNTEKPDPRALSHG